MPYLIMYEPKSPLFAGQETTRWQYKVILDDGNRIGLPELARRIKVPYPTLMVVIRTFSLKLSMPGQEHRHVQELIDIIKEAKRRTANRRPRGAVCPRCNGTGRVPRAIAAGSNVAAQGSGDPLQLTQEIPPTQE